MVKIKFKCSRCKEEKDGLWDAFMTAGFYDMASPEWADLAQPSDSKVCDDCLHKDPKYKKAYGKPSRFRPR